MDAIVVWDSSIDDVLVPREFDPEVPIKECPKHIREYFTKLARYKREDLQVHRQKSGAIYTGNPNSPSGYQKVLLSTCPEWFSELYWCHNQYEIRKSTKGRPKKMIIGPVRRPRVLKALGRIETESDSPTNLHTLLRDYLFEELINPDKANEYVVQDYFGTRIEDPHSQIPINAYDFIDQYDLK